MTDHTCDHCPKAATILITDPATRETEHRCEACHAELTYTPFFD